LLRVDSGLAPHELEKLLGPRYRTLFDALNDADSDSKDVQDCDTQMTVSILRAGVWFDPDQRNFTSQRALLNHTLGMDPPRTNFKAAELAAFLFAISAQPVAFASYGTGAGLMSALGQKQTWRGVRPMSALPPKADIGTQSWNVRFVPKADILRCSK
jgi:hypothetical protein